MLARETEAERSFDELLGALGDRPRRRGGTGLTLTGRGAAGGVAPAAAERRPRCRTRSSRAGRTGPKPRPGTVSDLELDDPARPAAHRLRAAGGVRGRAALARARPRARRARRGRCAARLARVRRPSIVMGGPMGAYEEDAHPWLAAEKRRAPRGRRGRIRSGACASARSCWPARSGASVYPGERGRGRRTRRSSSPPRRPPIPVFGECPASFADAPVARRHLRPPRPGATLLASSPAYPQPGLPLGRSYALQFHLEVSRELAREWGEVPAYAASLEAIRGPGRSTA